MFPTTKVHTEILRQKEPSSNYIKLVFILFSNCTKYKCIAYTYILMYSANYYIISIIRHTYMEDT